MFFNILTKKSKIVLNYGDISDIRPTRERLYSAYICTRRGHRPAPPRRTRPRCAPSWPLFASRASLAPELRGNAEPASSLVDPAPLPPSSRPSLVEQVPSGPGLAEPTPSLPCLVEPAPSPPSLVKLALSLLTYVEPAPLPPSPVEPAPSPPRLPSPIPASPRLGSRAASPPRPPRAPGRRTVLYSDEVGAGLGVLLAERLSQGVINDCHPGASVDCLIECISAGEFDRDSTLVVLLGNSVDCTKRDILKLSATLSAIDRGEVAIVDC
ncbi:uncharacterized protein LOC134805941 [Cydia splendana]|uniref:uncharacterized protein LOC134805941 n=1 Tax=Cydia splendana TaxID=1100963 RepID=UPI00300D907C